WNFFGNRLSVSRGAMTLWAVTNPLVPLAITDYFPFVMGAGDYPKVSFIMPTLNAEAILENCLASIAQQTYPRERYEILLADAHSKDATREIARRYGAIVLDDNGRNMEEGKRLALSHATGEYIIFVDADNELTHPDYIELAIQALAGNPQ